MKTLIALLVALMLCGCSKQPVPAPVEEHAMRGEVMRLDAQNQLATVKHEAIKDFMGAMTMDYKVRDKAEFEKLHVGDKIDSVVFVQGDDFWVGKIQVKP
ncbi:MAG: electron transport protein SCO1/SenC [Bryobacterales bacterium]|nr:electron transport protein SCO1/SenC [Bryobacterales bacterium]